VLSFRKVYQALLIVSRGNMKNNYIIQSFNNDHNHVMLSSKVCII